MAGAHVIQVVSCLLRYGPEYLRTLSERFEGWLEKNEYDSLKTLRGNMNLLQCPDASSYERANYMRVLQSWSPMQ